MYDYESIITFSYATAQNPANSGQCMPVAERRPDRQRRPRAAQARQARGKLLVAEGIGNLYAFFGGTYETYGGTAQ